MKLSDYVLQRLAEAGVRHVFLVPGGGAMHLNDSLGKQPGITFVSNLHEQASSIAAEAYAKTTGEMGVCMVTTGPGATNAITGLTGAWLDSTPCLFLSGQVKRPDIKTGTGLRQLGNQEIGIVEMVSSVTKYAVVVTDPNSIRYHLEKALYLAREGRPGPVWLDIPLDVQAAPIDPESLPGFTPEAATAVDKNALRAKARETLALLAKAERPVLFAGNGIRVAGAVEAFRQLVDRLGIPVQTTWLALDLIEEAHPLFAPRPGGMAPRSANFILQNSDFLLCLGARLDMATTGYSHERFARAATKVVCDIDQTEIDKLKGMKIDMPVVANVADFIDALLDVSSEIEQPARSAWHQRVAEWKARYPLTAPESSRIANALSLYDVARAISNAIPENTIIAPGSSGFASEIFHLMLQIKKGQRCFHNRGTGAMGFAIPSAIGACFASGKPVVSMDGDGGFQFNIQELAVIAAHKLPIAMFVFNNDGYASIRASQNGNFAGNLVGSDPSSGLVLPPLEKLVPAYGLRYEKIIKGDDVAAKVASVIHAGVPVICEVVVIPDEPREPRLSSSRRADGSMVSKPLEDLFPFLDREEFRANMLIPTIEE